MQEAAIVILNYNGEEMLKRFLPSVLKYSEFPVIVADNASTDQSLDFLNTSYPQIRVIRLTSNTGFAGGYNKALKSIYGEFEYFILLNSDVEVSASWDINLIDFLKQNPNVASVQPKITSALMTGFFDYAGAGGGFIDALGYPYCRGRIFDHIEEDTGQYDDAIEVDWSSGACMAVRAMDFNSLGGFDDRFFAHMEEIDLCWRLRTQGRKIYYLGKVEVLHLGGGTLSRTNARKTLFNFRNSLLMLHKNLPSGRFIKVYSIRLLLDILASLVFFLKGKPADGFAVIKSHFEFYQLKNKWIKPVMASKLPSESIKNIKSILWLYYIRRKKKFTQI